MVTSVPVSSPVCITVLPPGGSIHIRMHSLSGKGMDHSKFNVVSGCSVRESEHEGRRRSHVFFDNVGKYRNDEVLRHCVQALEGMRLLTINPEGNHEIIVDPYQPLHMVDCDFHQLIIPVYITTKSNPELATRLDDLKQIRQTHGSEKSNKDVFSSQTR